MGYGRRWGGGSQMYIIFLIFSGPGAKQDENRRPKGSPRHSKMDLVATILLPFYLPGFYQADKMDQNNLYLLLYNSFTKNCKATKWLNVKREAMLPGS